MSIEVGSKWVKDGEVVEVVENCKHVCVMGTMNCTWFIYKNENLHVLTSNDFLEQYKLYKPVYEYQYAYEFMPHTDMRITPEYFINDKEFFKERVINVGKYQRLDFTKRERT